MRQLTLWDTPTNLEHIVNVASVPLRSLFAILAARHGWCHTSAAG